MKTRCCCVSSHGQAGAWAPHGGQSSEGRESAVPRASPCPRGRCVFGLKPRRHGSPQNQPGPAGRHGWPESTSYGPCWAQRTPGESIKATRTSTVVHFICTKCFLSVRGPENQAHRSALWSLTPRPPGTQSAARMLTPHCTHTHRV